MDTYYGLIRDEIGHVLPDQIGTLLDLGCGTGATSAWVKQQRPDVRTLGVELNGEMAAQARTVMDSVITGSVEPWKPIADQIHAEVDVILCLDVLEHIEDPWGLLTAFHELLSSDGYLVTSIPNVRNLKVLVPLIFRGRFDYQDAGILDRTHLRFFTRSSMTEMIEGAGYTVEAVYPTGPVRRQNIRSIKGAFSWLANLATFGLLEEFFVHQYVLRARVSR